MAGYYASTSTADTWRDWQTVTSTATPTTYDTTWPTWVTASTDATTVTRTMSTTEDVWYTWADTSTTTTVTNDTWVTWTTDSTGEVRDVRRHVGAPQRSYQPPQRTPEQIRAQEARLERARIDREVAARKRQEAITRADELLMGSLSQEQKVDMERDGFFFVDSKRPGRRYRLRNGRSGNVDVMENNTVLHRLCAHPAMQVPDGDTRLAQKLMLEHQEEAFLGRANRFPARH